jgi:hypothetical protein
MKVIFLDIDGVLNSVDNMNALHSCAKALFPGDTRARELYTEDSYGQLFDERCIRHLQRIILATNADIVITSTWRKDGVSNLLNMWKDRNLPGRIIGVTPILNKPRGEEIEAYLIQNDFVTNYCIIDDIADMLFEQELNFVKTNGKFGITLDDANKVISILNETQES